MRIWNCWNVNTVKGSPCVDSSTNNIYTNIKWTSSSVFKNQLLSKLEINEVQHKCEGKGKQGHQVSGELIILTLQDWESRTIGALQALNARAADMKAKIVARLKTCTPCGRLLRVHDVSSKSQCNKEDVNATLQTIYCNHQWNQPADLQHNYCDPGDEPGIWWLSRLPTG